MFVYELTRFSVLSMLCDDLEESSFWLKEYVKNFTLFEIFYLDSIKQKCVSFALWIGLYYNIIVVLAKTL